MVSYQIASYVMMLQDIKHNNITSHEQLHCNLTTLHIHRFFHNNPLISSTRALPNIGVHPRAPPWMYPFHGYLFPELAIWVLVGSKIHKSSGMLGCASC